MFTGIIEHCGRVTDMQRHGQGLILTIDLGPLATGTKIGDSIAVSGSCLTVRDCTGTVATFDCSSESLTRTTLGSWQTGRRVNLERALAVGDRLGGHLVGGHIDGVGRIIDRRHQSDSETFTVQLPEDGSVRVVEKGSLTVDGISLTTHHCRGRSCQVTVIPHTLQATTLGQTRAGHAVNLEQDLLGRWVVARLSEQIS